MPAHAIAHYNFRLERTLMEQVCEFYESILGLRKGPRPGFASYGYWLYAGSQDVLHLSEETPEDKRDTGSSLTFDHVAFACTDWPEFEQRLRQREVTFITSRVPGSQRFQVFFRDPAGNGIELLFPSGQV